MQNRLYTYYGWTRFGAPQNLAAIPGAMASPLMAPPYLGLSSTGEVEARGDGVISREADPHLRSGPGVSRGVAFAEVDRVKISERPLLVALLDDGVGIGSTCG